MLSDFAAQHLIIVQAAAVVVAAVKPIPAMALTLRPPAPIDCNVATKPPAGTPPPLAVAEADIIQDAKLPNFMPAGAKPRMAGVVATPPTATAAPIVENTTTSVQEPAKRRLVIVGLIVI